jgi:hypothetical protein
MLSLRWRAKGELRPIELMLSLSTIRLKWRDCLKVWEDNFRNILTAKLWLILPRLNKENILRNRFKIKLKDWRRSSKTIKFRMIS